MKRAAPDIRRGLLPTGVTPGHLDLEGGPLLIERANGVFVVDAAGKEYLDGFAGYLTSSVGYGRARVAEAVAAQLTKMNYAPLDWRAHRPALELVEALLARTPSMARVFLCSGGSEAVDTALKLAMLWGARQTPRRRTIAFRAGSYHGATLGATAVTGFPTLRTPFEPLLPAAREAGEALSVDSVLRALDAGDDPGLALIAEPVSASARVEIPPAAYWRRVGAGLKERGALLISDEVLTGVGRSGAWLAGPGFGLEPDIIVLAKGLSGGYAPLGAVLVSARVAEMLEDEAFEHGFTFGGHPAGCTAALETLKILDEEELCANASRQGERLRAGLERVAGGFDGFGPVEGFGLLYSVGTAVEGDGKTALRSAFLENGLIAHVEEGSISFGPALSVSEGEIDELLLRFERGLRAFAGGSRG